MASEEKTAVSCCSVSKFVCLFFSSFSPSAVIFKILSLPLELSHLCADCYLLTIIITQSLLAHWYGAQRAFSNVLLKSQSLEFQGVYSILDHNLNNGFCPSSPVLSLYPILSHAAVSIFQHLPSMSLKRISLQTKFQFLFPWVRPGGWGWVEWPLAMCTHLQIKHFVL